MSKENAEILRTSIALVAVSLGVALAGCGDNGDTEEFEVPSVAMEPTLTEGETVDLDLDAYDSDSPQIDDIVVFHPPTGAENGECGVRVRLGEPCPEPTPRFSDMEFIQRVVAGPGDTLSIRNGHPVVDGVEAQEDFITPCRGGICDYPEEITIPPDHYFMLGDNRGVSSDSRFWGPVPASEIIGKVEVP
jgi:signal peptidase I